MSSYKRFFPFNHLHQPNANHAYWHNFTHSTRPKQSLGMPIERFHLHHPVYRQKYELNLKREFPRLPFYEDFHHWAGWGRQLIELHINYEIIDYYGLAGVEIKTQKSASSKPKLKADKTNGTIILDDATQLEGVPSIAWEYKLGNRSALEWILDQYKEKKPKDPTIAARFNTYRFADYKEHVIDLLQRLCTVSVKTMEIIEEMPV